MTIDGPVDGRCSMERIDDESVRELRRSCNERDSLRKKYYVEQTPLPLHILHSRAHTRHRRSPTVNMTVLQCVSGSAVPV